MDQKLQHISQLSGTQKYILSQYISERNEPWCYHTQFSYHLKINDLSLPLFFKAVKGILDRHPVFKTVMLFNGDAEPMQAINTGLDLQVQFANIEHLDSAGQSKWIDAFLLDDRNSPFDVYNATQPLCRTYVIKRGKDTLQFMLVFMHAIWDGWSLAVLLKEIFEYYHNLKDNPLLTPPAGEYEFSEFIDQEEKISNDDKAKAFWKKHLERHRSSLLTGKGAGGKENVNYKPVERMVSFELSSKLQQMQPLLKASIKSIYLAMFIRMIEDATDQRSTTIGVVTNGRGIELNNPLGTLGLLWNLAPLCIEGVDDDISQVKNVNRLLSEISAFGSYPLLNIQEDNDGADLLQAAFNFINFEGANLLPHESDIEFLEVGGMDKFHFPLHLLVGKNPFNKHISLVLNYDSRIYSESEIERKLDRYVRRLEALATSLVVTLA
jgi:hypothetical protein